MPNYISEQLKIFHHDSSSAEITRILLMMKEEKVVQ